jgi:hypothetical protein
VTYIATTGCRIRQTDLGVQICTYINVKNSYIDARLYRLAIQIDLATVVMDNLTGLQRIPINNENKKSGKKLWEQWRTSRTPSSKTPKVDG